MSTARESEPTSVRFALYFPWLVDAMDVDGIRAQWASYPTVVQVPPVPSADHPDLDDILEDHPWPLGLTVFEGGASGERVLFQGDRLAIEWNAQLTDHEYPRYAAMKQLLGQRYNEFTGLLTRNGVNDIPSIAACDCLYTTHLPKNNASTVAYRIVTGGDPPVEVKMPKFSSFHRHVHWRDNNPLDIDASDQEDGTRLSIQAYLHLAESESWEDAMDDCHQQALSLFATSTGGV